MIELGVRYIAGYRESLYYKEGWINHPVCSPERVAKVVKTRKFSTRLLVESRNELKVAKVENDSLSISEEIAHNSGAIMKVC